MFDIVPQDSNIPNSTTIGLLSRNVGILVTPANSLDTTSVVQLVSNKEYASEPPMFAICIINRVSSLGNLGQSQGAVASFRAYTCSVTSSLSSQGIVSPLKYTGDRLLDTELIGPS